MCQAGVNSCQVKVCCLHRYLVLVQQGAAPALICASKSQVRKHMSADRDVLPKYGHQPIWRHHCVH